MAPLGDEVKSRLLDSDMTAVAETEALLLPWMLSLRLLLPPLLSLTLPDPVAIAEAERLSSGFESECVLCSDLVLPLSVDEKLSLCDGEADLFSETEIVWLGLKLNVPEKVSETLLETSALGLSRVSEVSDKVGVPDVLTLGVKLPVAVVK